MSDHVHIVSKRAKNPIYSFRDENSYSLELKHARYADLHAQDLIKLEADHKINQLSLAKAYFGHFFHCWIFKASCLQGVRGFVSAHYWASYHLSVKIRLWEIHNKIDNNSIINMHNSRRQLLSEK